jgi:hypothetical protein
MSGKQLANPLDCQTDLFRGGSAHVMAGRHRAFQRQNLMDVRSNQLGELPKFLGRQLGQVTTALFASPYGMCDCLMRIPKG